MKKLINKYGFLILLFPFVCSAQTASISPIQLPAELQQAQKIDITQDYKGQIWIATRGDGLLKYDGEQFTVYKPEDDNNFTRRMKRMECITTDQTGNIWIGNYEDGLDKFDPETETFTPFRRNNNELQSLSCDSVKNLLVDSDGMLWVGTKLGLDMLNPETGEFTQIIGNSEDALVQSSQDVRKIYQDSRGTVWIGSVCDYTPETFDPSKGGLFRFEKKTGEITHFQHNEKDEHSLIDPRVRAIFEDSRGVFWVGSSGDGLHTMDREAGSFTRHRFDPKNPHKLSRPPISYTYHSPDHISFINEDTEGQIWIGTFSAGLNRYDPNTKTVKHFGTSEEGLYKTVGNDFYSCLKTKDNLLWMTDFYPGRNGQALYRISTSLNTVNHTNLGKSVYPFVQTTDSILWLGTNLGLVRKNLNGSFDTLLISKNNTSSENSINNLESDKLNNLWVCTSRGLFYYNTETNSFKEYRYYAGISNLPPADRIAYSTQLNDDGTITIIARSGIFVMDLKSGNILDKYLGNSSEASTIEFVYDIQIDSKDNYWLGTYNGLFQFDRKSKKIERLLQLQTRILTMYEDRKERLWIGTDHSGLFVYDLKTASFSPFNGTGNIIRNAGGIGKIAGDLDGNLWLLTRKGIVRVEPETKNTVIFGKSWNIDLNNLTGSLWTSLDGEIFLGTHTGYYHFFPGDLISENNISPEPFISRFFVGDRQLMSGDGLLKRPIEQTKEVTLNHNQNNFTIEFDNIDFLTDPSEKILEYKLESFDNNWRNKNEAEKAFYFNVPPGHYTFQLRAVNMYGNTGEKTLKIIVTPPWYTTWIAYSIYTILFILAVYFIHRFQRQRVIRIERERTQQKELEQAREIEKAYTELKSTQAQLIQSEKMASLGELTAGIAHEIQNPLNFVNNFSDVSKELMSELNSERSKMKGERDEAFEDEILKDIDQNLEKIHHHGIRASAIVKSMLQHSKASSGEKELIDINSLCDEYLRLAYHGMRAKDKSFNAVFRTQFDTNLRKVKVVPQDIGRVLLNLINNAFQAVGTVENPEVVVSTKEFDSQIEIGITDNGQGIPNEIKDKIFQPFFTTKPTGQGTGLGLSLSYDIIKAHGGEIKVESDESKGTTFILSIPVT